MSTGDVYQSNLEQRKQMAANNLRDVLAELEVKYPLGVPCSVLAAEAELDWTWTGSALRRDLSRCNAATKSLNPARTTS